MIRPAVVEWEDSVAGLPPWFTRETLPDKTGACWSIGWVEHCDAGLRVFSVLGQFGDPGDRSEGYGAAWVIPHGCVGAITYLDEPYNITWPQLEANNEEAK